MEATRLLLLACAVLVAAAWSASARPQSSDTGATALSTTTITLHMEEPCAQQGGQCLKADECPEGKLSNATGLCPKQQSLGVECCHGLSVLERRCHARGGMCRPSTECRSRALWLPEAKDCAKGETCCALIN